MWTAVVGVSLMAACGEGEPEPRPSTPTPTRPPVTITCNAALNAGSSPYTVEGNVLRLGSGSQALELQRAAAGSPDMPVYGTWTIPVGPMTGDPALLARAQLKIVAKMRIESGRVTVTSECSSTGGNTTATASSAATVTSSALTVHASAQDQKTLTIP
jgi:hypothetical protein